MQQKIEIALQLWERFVTCMAALWESNNKYSPWTVQWRILNGDEIHIINTIILLMLSLYSTHHVFDPATLTW